MIMTAEPVRLAEATVSPAGDGVVATSTGFGSRVGLAVWDASEAGDVHDVSAERNRVGSSLTERRSRALSIAGVAVSRGPAPFDRPKPSAW
jgi:hypothetical protein